MKKTNFAPILMLFCIVNMTFAQNTSTYSNFVARRYFEVGLDLIKTTPGFTPPVASRALGYMGLTAYEAAVPGMPDYSTSDGVLPSLGPNALTDPSGSVHIPTALNNAMAFVMDSLFQNMSAAERTKLINLRDSINALYAAHPNYSASKTWGETLAAEIFAYSKTDGAHQGYLKNTPSGYVSPTGYGYWEPTPPSFQAIPIQPFWGNNRTFHPDANGALIPGPHLAFDTMPGSQFHTITMEVYNVSKTLTQDQINIAEYWADGPGTVTPPGHSISILNQFIINRNENLETAVLAYAKLGMAVSDAFVNCWKTKYDYHLMRPVTYINRYIDPTWLPLIGTPPFPEYTSGHSTQSGATCAVLESIYGNNAQFTDITHGSNFGGPRSFSSFNQFAEEAANSRLYGGIHYEFSNQLGIEVGKAVGSNINGIFATQLRKNPVTDVEIQVSESAQIARVGDEIIITISLFNKGLTSLSNVQIKDLLPTSLQYISHDTWYGTYNPSTGIWEIPSVAAGTATLDLRITVRVTQEGVPYHVAELIALDQKDVDSTPNNAILSEDDIAGGCVSVPMTICAPNLTLSAPAGYTSYEWFYSADQGATYTPAGNTQSITVTTGGYYKFVVNGGTLGTCGNQLCCPLIVQEQCCPVQICLPITARRN